MNFLQRILDLFRTPEAASPSRQERVVAAPPPTVEAVRPTFLSDKRSHKRFPVPNRAQMHFSDPFLRGDCRVLDASRSGARVVVSHEIAANPLRGLSIFFNGYTLRTRVRVAWQRSTDEGCEMGLVFETSREDVSHVLDLFVNFLCWRSGRLAA